MALGRSFMKGPRFAQTPSKVTACERCVFGSGKHACGKAPSGYAEHRFELRKDHSPACSICGRPDGHAIHIRG